MREFKVGDVVRTIKERDYTDCPLFPVGTVGTITNISKQNLPYKVEADGDFWWYSADMLELIETKGEIRKITLDEAERISKMVKNSCSNCPFDNNGCSAIRCSLSRPESILEDFNERYDDLIKVLKVLNETLDKGEKEYLTAVLKPYKRFEDKLFIRKLRKFYDDSKEYLVIKAEGENDFYDLDFIFPYFKKGTKYAGLELDRRYTLKELGITL